MCIMVFYSKNLMKYEFQISVVDIFISLVCIKSSSVEDKSFSLCLQSPLKDAKPLY